jgi:secondary thiamine-phosphate synthase enzyme
MASLHTTGGVTINENADPDVERDFFYALEKLVPQSPAFRHAEGNSDSHVKSSLVGLSVQVPVTGGKMVLGTWQSVYFCEFDGPRSRRVLVTVMGE